MFATLGHVLKLHEHGQLNDLEEISGASAGAMIAVLWVLFKEEGLKILLDIDMTKFVKIRIDEFLKNGGLSNMNGCRSEFIRIMGPQSNMTMQQLYDLTKIKVHIAAFSLVKNTVDYFSVDTTPDASVLDCLCKTCCVPILFSPVDGYIDGGVGEILPVTPFIHHPVEDLYSIRITFDQVGHGTGVVSYLKRLVTIFMGFRPSCPIQHRGVTIDVGDTNVFDFKMTSSNKIRIFGVGYSHPICTN